MGSVLSINSESLPLNRLCTEKKSSMMQLNQMMFTQVRRTSIVLRRAFSEVNAQSVTPVAPVAKTTDTKKRAGPKKNISNDIVYLNGMSKFASRKDLLIFLGPHKPTKIDPVLNLHHNFTGVYGLQFATPDELDAFQKYVFSVPKKFGTQSYSVLQSKWFDPRRSVAASTCNVTPSTVRCVLLDKPHSYADRFVQFFENQNLHEDNVRKISFGQASSGPVTGTSGHTSHYLLQFESPEEAVRAVVENQYKTMFGSRMKLDLFIC